MSAFLLHNTRCLPARLAGPPAPAPACQSSHCWRRNNRPPTRPRNWRRPGRVQAAVAGADRLRAGARRPRRGLQIATLPATEHDAEGLRPRRVVRPRPRPRRARLCGAAARRQLSRTALDSRRAIALRRWPPDATSEPSEFAVISAPLPCAACSLVSAEWAADGAGERRPRSPQPHTQLGGHETLSESLIEFYYHCCCNYDNYRALAGRHLSAGTSSATPAT